MSKFWITADVEAPEGWDIVMCVNDNLRHRFELTPKPRMDAHGSVDEKDPLAVALAAYHAQWRGVGEEIQKLVRERDGALIANEMLVNVRGTLESQLKAMGDSYHKLYNERDLLLSSIEKSVLASGEIETALRETLEREQKYIAREAGAQASATRASLAYQERIKQLEGNVMNLESHIKDLNEEFNRVRAAKISKFYPSVEAKKTLIRKLKAALSECLSAKGATLPSAHYDEIDRLLGEDA